MKVIDLLNKIANGEEIPKEMCIQGDLFFKSDGTTSTYEILKFLYEFDIKLNDEVEIIEEEEKKIPEKIKLYTLSNNDSADFTTLQDFNNRDIKRAINGILDYLKSKGE